MRHSAAAHALGTGPAHSAYEQAALARIVSWATIGGRRRPGRCSDLRRRQRSCHRSSRRLGGRDSAKRL